MASGMLILVFELDHHQCVFCGLCCYWSLRPPSRTRTSVHLWPATNGVCSLPSCIARHRVAAVPLASRRLVCGHDRLTATCNGVMWYACFCARSLPVMRVQDQAAHGQTHDVHRCQHGGHSQAVQWKPAHTRPTSATSSAATCTRHRAAAQDRPWKPAYT